MSEHPLGHRGRRTRLLVAHAEHSRFDGRDVLQHASRRVKWRLRQHCMDEDAECRPACTFVRHVFAGSEGHDRDLAGASRQTATAGVAAPRLDLALAGRP